MISRHAFAVFSDFFMAGRSSCPECGTILRIRDRSFVGRRVNCPECKTTLKIESTDDQGDFVTRRMTATEIQQIKAGHREAAVNPDKKVPRAIPVRSTFSRIAYSPLTAAWLLAIAGVSLIAVLTLSPKFRFTSAPVQPSRTETPPLVQTTEPQATETVESTNVPIEAPPLDNKIDVRVSNVVDVTDSISALEPANLDKPLPWPPDMGMTEVVQVPQVPVPPVPEKVDVVGKMTLPIDKYKQSKVRRRDLLDALQEQLDVKIRYDVQEIGAASLDETVDFELNNTTLGDVMKTVANKAGWQIIIEDAGIRLKPIRSTAEPK